MSPLSRSGGFRRAEGEGEKAVLSGFLVISPKESLRGGEAIREGLSYYLLLNI